MKTRFVVVSGMILAAAAFRLVPHPPNATPLLAMALFGGAQFADRRLAFLVPLGAMFVSDLFLGFHATMPFVYGSVVLCVELGRLLRNVRHLLPIAGTALAGSILFFLITNFGVWAVQSLYPKTAAGLLTCYTAAIPFLRNSLMGDGLYTLLFFGGFAALERGLPALREVGVVHADSL